MTKPHLSIIKGGIDNVEEIVPEVARISELRSFTDGEGRTVVGQFPVDGEDSPMFVGSFMVETNRGPVRLPIEFPEGATLEECFEHFDGMAKATIEKVQKEANQQPLIVTPNQSKGGIII